jgi:hypothetical protein
MVKIGGFSMARISSRKKRKKSKLKEEELEEREDKEEEDNWYSVDKVRTTSHLVKT